MSNRLSHSSVSRFQTCPKSFEFHYRQHLRSIKQSSALLFGSALDVAVGTLLNKKDNPEEEFIKAWTYADVNGKREYLPTATDIVYANSDLDMDLLQTEDYQEIAKAIKLEGTSIHKEVEELYKEKEYLGYDGLPKERKEFFNLVNWYSMMRKGLVMLKTFEKEVLPNIKEVLGVQVPVKLENGDGDSVIGFADMVVMYEGYDVPIILDLKTSAREYDEDLAVVTSPQLSLYLHALSEDYKNTRKAGYIVLNKHIRKNKTKKCSVCGFDGTGSRHKTCSNEIEGKRCNGEWTEKIKPEAKVQILIEDIPEQTEEIVLENIDHINTMITQGVFHRNLNSCIAAWGKCPFFNKCYYNKEDGLVKVEEKK